MPMSVVYGPDKRTVVLNATLQAGQGVFHDDRAFWHDVTKVRSRTRGYRDIFGLDIHSLPLPPKPTFQ